MLKTTLAEFKGLSYNSKLAFVLLLIFTTGYFVTQEPMWLYIFLGITFMLVASYKLDWGFYALLACIPISFTYVLSFSLTTDVPDEPMMWVMYILTLFGLIKNQNIFPISFWENKIVLLLAIMFFWSIICTINATEVLPSIKFLFAKSWFLVCFLILPILVFKKLTHINTALIVFLCFFIAVVITVLYRHSLTGFAFDTINRAAMPIYHNHVNYSVTISLVIPFVFLGFINAKLLINKLLFIFILLLLLVALYYSFGRGAWMATFATIIVYFAVKFKKIKVLVISSFLVLFCTFYWLSENQKYFQFRPLYEKTIMHDNIFDHIIATFRGRDVSSMERIYRWIAAFQMVEDRPILGVGPNNFAANYHSYTVTNFATWVSRNLEYSTVHNYFLLMMVEQGIPATILYGIFVFSLLAFGQNLYHRTTDPVLKRYVMATVCMIVAFFINNFLSDLLESEEIGTLLFLGISILIAIDMHNKKVKKLV